MEIESFSEGEEKATPFESLPAEIGERILIESARHVPGAPPLASADRRLRDIWRERVRLIARDALPPDVLEGASPERAAELSRLFASGNFKLLTSLAWGAASDVLKSHGGRELAFLVYDSDEAAAARADERRIANGAWTVFFATARVDPRGGFVELRETDVSYRGHRMLTLGPKGGDTNAATAVSQIRLSRWLWPWYPDVVILWCPGRSLTFSGLSGQRYQDVSMGVFLEGASIMLRTELAPKAPRFRDYGWRDKILFFASCARRPRESYFLSFRDEATAGGKEKIVRVPRDVDADAGGASALVFRELRKYPRWTRDRTGGGDRRGFSVRLTKPDFTPVVVAGEWVAGDPESGETLGRLAGTTAATGLPADVAREFGYAGTHLVSTSVEGPGADPGAPTRGALVVPAPLLLLNSTLGARTVAGPHAATFSFSDFEFELDLGAAVCLVSDAPLVAAIQPANVIFLPLDSVWLPGLEVLALLQRKDLLRQAKGKLPAGRAPGGDRD